MRKSAIFLGLASIYTTSVLAGESVNIVKDIEVSKHSTLEINVPVGQLELSTYDGTSIEIEVEVEEKNDGWFSDADLDNVELEVDESSTTISLEINEDETIQHWVVKVPVSMNLDLDMGVGEVEVEGATKDLNIDVGVGEVDVRLESNDYRRIDLDSGVGGADLRGFKGVDSTRAVVSEKVRWHGDGEHTLSVDVGVGDIDIRH